MHTRQKQGKNNGRLKQSQENELFGIFKFFFVQMIKKPNAIFLVAAEI